jgi:hypothetical protein
LDFTLRATSPRIGRCGWKAAPPSAARRAANSR